MITRYISIILRNVRLIDVVDIAIISLFIYLILVWFIHARAKFMFIGMAVVGAIYFIARYFGLYLTTMALQGFFACTLIMVVVIFQDDFRHFFESIAMLGVQGQRGLAASFSQNIACLVNAFTNFSRKKIGALVVLRGDDPLDRHLEAGYILDGKVSQPLLESIFDRHAPAHDGAVIIDGDRVVRFACYLPLSTNIEAVGRPGTRHAAALGISERADVLCLVASEEDGVISIAHDGRMSHLRTITQLDTALEAFYQKKFPRNKGNSIGRFLTKHIVEKIVAVILACGFWVTFAHRTELIRRDFLVPLEYRNLAADTVIREPKLKEATVTLSGTEQEFNLLKPQELKISLDMSNVGDGEYVISLTKDLLSAYAGLSVVDIDPGEVSLDVYRLLTVTVPLEIRTKGKLPAGVKLDRIRLEPEQISVIVPSTLAKESSRIFVDVDLKNITENTVFPASLAIPPEVRFPDNKKPEVTVIVEGIEPPGQ